jgi:hypothetical protein
MDLDETDPNASDAVLDRELAMHPMIYQAAPTTFIRAGMRLPQSCDRSPAQ